MLFDSGGHAALMVADVAKVHLGAVSSGALEMSSCLAESADLVDVSVDELEFFLGIRAVSVRSPIHACVKYWAHAKRKG